jgi:hypothetical protein
LQGAGLLLMMYGFSFSHRDNMEPDGSGNDVLTVAVKAEADEAAGAEVGDSTNANTVDASEMDEASDTSDTGQSGEAGEEIEIILRVGPKRYTYSAFCSLIDALTRRAAALRVGDGAEENGGGRTKGRDGGEAGGDIQEGQRTLWEQQSQKEEQGSNGVGGDGSREEYVAVTTANAGTGTSTGAVAAATVADAEAFGGVADAAADGAKEGGSDEAYASTNDGGMAAYMAQMDKEVGGAGGWGCGGDEDGDGGDEGSWGGGMGGTGESGDDDGGGDEDGDFSLWMSGDLGDEERGGGGGLGGASGGMGGAFGSLGGGPPLDTLRQTVFDQAKAAVSFFDAQIRRYGVDGVDGVNGVDAGAGVDVDIVGHPTEASSSQGGNGNGRNKVRRTLDSNAVSSIATVSSSAGAGSDGATTANVVLAEIWILRFYRFAVSLVLRLVQPDATDEVRRSALRSVEAAQEWTLLAGVAEKVGTAEAEVAGEGANACEEFRARVSWPGEAIPAIWGMHAHRVGDRTALAPLDMAHAAQLATVFMRIRHSRLLSSVG